MRALVTKASKRTLRAGDNAQPSYITAVTSLSHHNPLHVLLLLRLLLYTVTTRSLSQSGIIAKGFLV